MTAAGMLRMSHMATAEGYCRFSLRAPYGQVPSGLFVVIIILPVYSDIFSGRGILSPPPFFNQIPLKSANFKHKPGVVTPVNRTSPVPSQTGSKTRKFAPFASKSCVCQHFVCISTRVKTHPKSLLELAFWSFWHSPGPRNPTAGCVCG